MAGSVTTGSGTPERPDLPDLPDVPWRPRPRATRARTPISLERIVDTALRIVDAEGTEGVTMRRVATELGTGPASLYAYVESREELLVRVHERVIEEVDFPDFREVGWQDGLRRFAASVHEVYRRHADIALLSFADIPTTEASLRGAEDLLAAMRDGGVPMNVAAWAMDRISLYIGADAYEGWLMQRRFGGATPEESEERGRAYFAQVGEFFAALPRDRFPVMTSHLGELMDGDGEQRFAFGVDMFIAGIASTVPAKDGGGSKARSRGKR
ncbi:TetR/AcrR family transcriptional regulator [Intrasporangium sp. YIM S08009]|uniref:TetR/AcrR family transcriptional regulator n=1 Tax=Intrasporangium zincisolvens TaxID=3080018 RepID=UPI002B05D50D|nr:TetR/AcrR family transcriptional regulator C-terminal domain-containing protein [Intrasporangium sp. YIM S08009]